MTAADESRVVWRQEPPLLDADGDPVPPDPHSADWYDGYAACHKEHDAARSEPPAEGLDVEHITYCRTCGKTRFVEWLHRNCVPEQPE